MHHPTNRMAYTMAFVIPVMEHLLECKGSKKGHNLFNDAHMVTDIRYPERKPTAATSWAILNS